MSSARLIRPALLRRGAAVSAGALALCLSAAGTSYADPLPSPPQLPSADGVVTVVDQTITSVTGKDPGLTPPATTTPPSTTTPPAGAPKTTTPKSAKHAAAATTALHRAVTPRAHAAAQSEPASMATWVAPVTTAALNLPPATTQTTQVAAAPAVAPLLIPQVTQRITPASAMIEVDKHSGSPVRGILLTLAIAAALALGYEHGRLARQGVRA